VTIRVDGTATTIAAVGGRVLVLATAASELPLTLTPCYLARSDGALAISHLRLTTGHETFSQGVVAPAEPHATIAGACLLDHAAALRDTADQLTEATITVDVDPATLDRAAHAWGPPLPPG
jgi:hypothetical protein